MQPAHHRRNDTPSASERPPTIPRLMWRSSRSSGLLAVGLLCAVCTVPVYSQNATSSPTPSPTPPPTPPPTDLKTDCTVLLASDKQVKCRFPFTYNGVSYSQCIFEDNPVLLEKSGATPPKVGNIGWCNTTLGFPANCAECFEGRGSFPQNSTDKIIIGVVVELFLCLLCSCGCWAYAPMCAMDVSEMRQKQRQEMEQSGNAPPVQSDVVQESLDQLKQRSGNFN